MTAADHIKRYPRARTSTIAHLVERDRMNEKLRQEIKASRRQRLRDIVKRRLWPSWVWR